MAYCISRNAWSVFTVLVSLFVRVSQGFWGTREHWQNIEGNKGTLANFWEQGTKFRKITIRKHSERVWEHGNIGQFWKGTREQGPPWETLTCMFVYLLGNFTTYCDYLFVCFVGLPRVCKRRFPTQSRLANIID